MKLNKEPSFSIINLEEFSKLFVMAHDKDQADVFNSIAKYWDMHCSISGKTNMEMQICYFSDKLTPQACKFITNIAKFIDLKEEK